MADRLIGLGLAVIALATVTTLVLPGRQTASVATAGGSAFAKVINSALGRG